MIVVRMNPDGSLGPGIRNLAITPARNPMMMVTGIFFAELEPYGVCAY
jgi:hypothetical protein